MNTFIRKQTVDGGVTLIKPWTVRVYDKHTNAFMTQFYTSSYEQAIEEAAWTEMCVCDYKTEIHSPDGEVEDV